MSNSRIIEVLRKRRSIRQFTDQPVEKAKADLLIEAAVRSPTSRGLNPWEFIVIDEPALLNKLGVAKQKGSAFLAGAPLAIIVAADTSKSDVWTEDCSIAAFAVQMVAEELGLGSCWAQIRNRPHNEKLSANEYLKDLLSLPEAFSVECVIGVGYPAEHKSGHNMDDLPFNQVHRNNLAN